LLVHVGFFSCRGSEIWMTSEPARATPRRPAARRADGAADQTDLAVLALHFALAVSRRLARAERTICSVCDQWFDCRIR
jgi:hypothetical protein